MADLWDLHIFGTMERGCLTLGRNGLDGGISGSKLGANSLQVTSKWLQLGQAWPKPSPAGKLGRLVQAPWVVQVLHRGLYGLSSAFAGHGPPQFGRDVRPAGKGLDDLHQMEVKVDSVVKLRFKLLFQSISIDFHLSFKTVSIYFNPFQSISIYFNLFQSISIYFNLS